MLKSITLDHGLVSDWSAYPFSVPAIATMDTLQLRERVCFFTGENGSGKSTLLEAIAAHYGFGREGGSRNFAFREEREQTDVSPLIDALKLSFSVRTGAGFFLRAESFFNLAAEMEERNAVRGARRPAALALGGRGFHAMSHGESFFALLETRMRENGLFLMDEPEAALSPQRQLSMLVLMHDVLRAHGSAQFVICTHSPVLLGFPGAQILSFDGAAIHEVTYDGCAPVQIMRRFINHRENFLAELLQEE